MSGFMGHERNSEESVRPSVRLELKHSCPLSPKHEFRTFYWITDRLPSGQFARRSETENAHLEGRQTSKIALTLNDFMVMISIFVHPVVFK